MSHDATIVAVSTPAGVGGVAVLRLSGPQALPLVLGFLSAKTLPPRKAVLARFEVGGELVDELIAVYYPAPHSYTGDDVVELSCHGSLYIQQTLLQALVDAGARLAEPGEFTLRAFLNHRLDLSQAEAVADLIDAATPAAHRLAISQMRGGYAAELAGLRSQLLDLTSLLELELDFSQEDLEFADRRQLLNLVDLITTRIAALRGTFQLGNAIKQGIPVAIVGRPNAGKSSLLNALLNDDRAIVSPVAGTTRDTIEETLRIGSAAFRFIDTAGLRHATDTVEQQGVARSYAAAAKASVVLFVFDAAETAEQTRSDLEELLKAVDFEGKRLLMVGNKADLGAFGGYADSRFPLLGVSCRTGAGLEALRQWLTDYNAQIGSREGTTPLLSNLRHYEALGRVEEALENVRQGLEQGVPADLVAVDLRDALYHLGSITGQVASQDILSNIFSRFCVGK